MPYNQAVTTTDAGLIFEGGAEVASNVNPGQNWHFFKNLVKFNGKISLEKMSQKLTKTIKLEIAFQKDEIESIKTNALDQNLKVSELLREPALKKASAKIILHPSIEPWEMSNLDKLQLLLEELTSQATDAANPNKLSFEHHLGVAIEITSHVCQPIQSRMGSTVQQRFDPTRSRPKDLKEAKEYLSVRVTEAERDLLQKRSSQLGMTIAQFVRATALNKRIPEKSVASDENWKAYAQIMAINQKIDRLNDLTDNLWAEELNAMLKQLRRTMVSLIDVGFEEESARSLKSTKAPISATSSNMFWESQEQSY